MKMKLDEKEKMNTDMLAELSEESEKVRYYLENILIIGALKGYQVSQETYDYSFWKNLVPLKGATPIS
jgi:hypothetical protein